jgi:hypothetical protein
MSKTSHTFLTGIVCATLGFGAGIFYGSSQDTQCCVPMQWLKTLGKQLPWLTPTSKDDPNSPYETYKYPSIKWRAKPISQSPGAIVQLWTTYEQGSKPGESGVIKYKLMLFKVPDKQSCEVQLLDEKGFKLLQFTASDFHEIPGAPNIIEARDNLPCSEEEYKKVRDYSTK